MKSQLPNCTRTNADHINDFEEIQPGILFLNDYNGTVLIDDQPLQLTGTFIIKHHNSTVRLHDKAFYVQEITYLEPLPAILQQSTAKDQLEEFLSLQIIKELEIRNRNKIANEDLISKISLTPNTGITVILIALIIILTA